MLTTSEIMDLDMHEKYLFSALRTMKDDMFSMNTGIELVEHLKANQFLVKLTNEITRDTLLNMSDDGYSLEKVKPEFDSKIPITCMWFEYNVPPLKRNNEVWKEQIKKSIANIDFDRIRRRK